MIRNPTRQYVVRVPETVATRIEQESAGDVHYLEKLVTSMMGQGACVHPPLLVDLGGLPQCRGCGEFL